MSHKSQGLIEESHQPNRVYVLQIPRVFQFVILITDWLCGWHGHMDLQCSEDQWALEFQTIIGATCLLIQTRLCCELRNICLQSTGPWFWKMGRWAHHNWKVFFLIGKSLLCLSQLSWKSNFPPPTIKPVVWPPPILQNRSTSLPVWFKDEVTMVLIFFWIFHMCNFKCNKV